MRLEAMSSTMPSAMLNHPSLRATISEGASAFGPDFTTFGSLGRLLRLPNLLSMFMTLMLWLQYDFDATVLLVAKDLVHLGSLFEPGSVGDDKRRVDLTFFDAAQ